MIVVHRFVEEPERCVYLPDQEAQLEYEVAVQLSPEEYEARMNAGWRKFGMLVFRPICAECDACRPIRILAGRFTPDRSQRRVLKRNTDLEVRFAPPTLDAARLALYQRYHAAQALRKGWPDAEKSAQDYIFQFVRNPIPSVEISIWEGDLLRAVALTEATPAVVSGIYHYHEPDCRERSLGTFTILQIIALARRMNRPYAYFGYYVAGCGSLSYKARYRPFEILGADGAWRSEPLAP